MKEILTQRIGELLAKFPIGGVYENTNCHGAVLYVHGLADEFKKAEVVDLVRGFPQVEDSSHEVPVKDAGEGDLILFYYQGKGIGHSGVVMTRNGGDPSVFESDGKYGCTIKPLGDIVESGFFSKVRCFRVEDN
ncbi:hypothetical protein KY331_02840 [Candidatus Woesearchaeota archaeon]|nr:hypothetical protein [Candidatus Woesearchaeota archaeon]